MVSRKVDWPSNTGWTPSPEDIAYFEENPVE